MANLITFSKNTTVFIMIDQSSWLSKHNQYHNIRNITFSINVTPPLSTSVLLNGNTNPTAYFALYLKMCKDSSVTFLQGNKVTTSYQTFRASKSL